jgi:cell wall-associated NlpC family hydrolase
VRLIAPLTDAERAGMIAAARALVGVPFRHRGRSLRGVDCVGVVAMALATQGRGVEARAHYGRNPANDGLREVCQAHFGDPVAELQAGDVALLAWHDDERNREPNHVGVLFDHPNGGLAMVHALKQNNRVIAHRLEAQHFARIVEGYRP